MFYPTPTTLAPPEQPLSQSVLLSVLDRTMDQTWLLPLKQPGPGYEVLEAYASIWNRVSQAAVNSLNVFILSSQGGALAQGFVTFSRNSQDLPQETVKAGSMVTTSNGNRVFFTVDDAIFGFGSTTAVDANTGLASIPVQAAAMDWQWNVLGQVDAANGTILPGDIDTMLLPIVQSFVGSTSLTAGVSLPVATLPVVSTQGFTSSGTVYVQTASNGLQPVQYASLTSNAFLGCSGGTGSAVAGSAVAPNATPQLVYDPAISVANVSPTTGGRPAILDQMAEDMGLTRQTGEPDAHLASRMRILPDTVSPAAIQRALSAILGPYGATGTVQEPLGIGALPSPPGYSGITVGFMDADPLPLNGVVQPTAIGLWYFDQNNPSYVPGATGQPGPGLDVAVFPGDTRQVGLIGPSDESIATSRGFLRINIPWIGGSNAQPQGSFSFMGSTGLANASSPNTDLLYPITWASGPVPSQDYPWPPSGFFAEAPGQTDIPPTPGSYASVPATATTPGELSPTSIAAGRIYDTVSQQVAGGVNFEISVG